jgi:hypothetical protein
VTVEAARHYRHAPGVWGALHQRQVGQIGGDEAIAWRAQDRLHRRYRRLLGRGKARQQVVVAVARELLGFAWAVAHAVKGRRQGTAEQHRQRVGAPHEQGTDRRGRVRATMAAVRKVLDVLLCAGGFGPNARSYSEAAFDGSQSCGADPGTLE